MKYKLKRSGITLIEILMYITLVTMCGYGVLSIALGLVHSADLYERASYDLFDKDYILQKIHILTDSSTSVGVSSLQDRIMFIVGSTTTSLYEQGGTLWLKDATTTPLTNEFSKISSFSASIEILGDTKLLHVSFHLNSSSVNSTEILP